VGSPANLIGDNPLEAGSAAPYVRVVESDEGDVEIFERIPWDALEKPQDRRWIVYLAAAAVVMGAIGVSVGRGMIPVGSPPATAPSVTSPTPEPTTPPDITVPLAAAPETPTTWTEADLMAVPAETLEDSAAVMAEWFIVDYFTRDGGTADAGGRSFVEWAAVVDRTWVSNSVMELTVVVRRLAAEGDNTYQRIPVEGWLVTAELGDEGWVVVQGPVATAALDPAVDLVPLDGPVPAEVASRGGDETVRGAAEIDGGWIVEVEWTDPAGLDWVIRRRVESES
jgi:hypothetical protein